MPTKSSATLRRWERAGTAIAAFASACSVSEISLSTSCRKATRVGCAGPAKGFPPGSVLDDLHALAAVASLPRPYLDHQGHLEPASRHDGDADREARDLLRHGRRQSLDARDDRLQVVRVRDLQDDLRVALAQHVLVDLRRALRDDHKSEAEFSAFRRERPKDLRRRDLPDLGTEIVRLLHDEHHRRDATDLAEFEHRGREAVHDELLDVGRNALQVDDRRLALDHEFVNPRSFLREDLDLAEVFELIDQRGVLGVVLALEDADDVADRVVFRRLPQEVQRLAQRGQVGPDLRRAREGQDVPRIEIAERELERPAARIDLRVRGEYLDDVRVGSGFDPESSRPLRVLPLLPKRGVLPVRVDDHAGHMVFHELFDEDARDVRLPAARLREDRNVLLYHGVDVEEDGHVVACQEPDVGAVFPVLVEADDLLDRGGLRLADGLAGAERGARDLEQSAVVAVPDHADLGRHALLDVDRVAVAHLLGAVQRQIRLPLNLIDSAEDDATGLVLDLDELVALDRIDDGTTE